jgi:hypothetical protein
MAQGRWGGEVGMVRRERGWKRGRDGMEIRR